jgi:hypothetical protein
VKQFAIQGVIIHVNIAIFEGIPGQQLYEPIILIIYFETKKAEVFAIPKIYKKTVTFLQRKNISCCSNI